MESGRWHKRRAEDDASFASSTHSMHAKSMHLDQSAVWHSVAESQEVLGAALYKSVHAVHSPSSYQLSVEDPDLENRKRDYEQKLGRLPKSAADAGYAFYVNGERNSVDIYASTAVPSALGETPQYRDSRSYFSTE
jgi:hypothetical protein